MKTLLIIVIIIIAILIIKYFSEKILNNNSKNENEIKQEYNFNGTLNKYILTDHELVFFQQLKRITDQYELYIFPKVRISDIISTNNKSDLGKINSKHIDFTICTKNSTPLLFVELDDSSHNSDKAIENDNKKDIIFKSIGKSIFRVKPGRRNEALYSINKILKDKTDYLK